MGKHNLSKDKNDDSKNKIPPQKEKELKRKMDHISRSNFTLRDKEEKYKRVKQDSLPNGEQNENCKNKSSVFRKYEKIDDIYREKKRRDDIKSVVHVNSCEMEKRNQSKNKEINTVNNKSYVHSGVANTDALKTMDLNKKKRTQEKNSTSISPFDTYKLHSRKDSNSKQNRSPILNLCYKHYLSQKCTKKAKVAAFNDSDTTFSSSTKVTDRVSQSSKIYPTSSSLNLSVPHTNYLRSKFTKDIKCKQLDKLVYDDGDTIFISLTNDSDNIAKSHEKYLHRKKKSTKGDTLSEQIEVLRKCGKLRQSYILEHLKTYFQNTPLTDAIQADENKMAYPRSILHDLNMEESKIVSHFLTLVEESEKFDSRIKLIKEKKELFRKLIELEKKTNELKR